MIRYTTPTFLLEVDRDLTDVNVYVSLEQGTTFKEDIKVTPDIMTVSEGKTTIKITPSQETTGKLKIGSQLRIQINVINSLGVREASEIRSIGVSENLLEEIIEYDE